MVIELGPLQIDFGGTDAGQVGESACDMSDYTAPVTYHDPPPGYEQRLSADGATELVFPRAPVGWALLPGLPALLFLTWMVFLISAGEGMFSVLFALITGYCLVKLAVQCSSRTSLVVRDHRIQRRWSLAGRPGSQTEFVVDRLEIDNGVWSTGRGSTDTLSMITASGRHELESTEATVSRAKKTGEQWWKRASVVEPHRLAPQPGRPPIAADILHLGQFIARHANVPLALVVRGVPEPNYDD